MQIIGLSGYARSGKDEAAKVLIEEFGFQRVAFADKLRDFLQAQNPIVGNTGATIIIPQETYVEATPDNIKDWLHFPAKNCNIRLNDVLRRVGWSGYKETQYYWEIRTQLQRLGTEAGRETLWDSIWVDAAFANVPEDARVVVTDCRFPNEAQAIKARPGKIWRVMREGVGPANAHPSETSLDDWRFDAYIHNDGTLEDYYKSVRRRYLETRW